jgi:hypothetical protein
VYYQHFVLNFLQQEELANPTSRLVRTLRNRRRVVYKKDIAAQFPLAKNFLYQFSREHPEVLADFRNWLIQDERTKKASDVGEEDERLIAGALTQALRAIPAGDTGAAQFHKLIIGVVEFVFFPSLMHPRKEHEIHQGRKRIDIVMENGALTGIFHNIPVIRRLPCSYIPFECKNYTTEIANPELDQLAGRFSVNRGKRGFLCCRQFEDRGLFLERCRDTLRDDRGLVLPLDDQTVLRFLSMIEDGRREGIEAALWDLVAEVWAT